MSERTRKRGPVSSRPSIFQRTDDGVPELAEQPDISTPSSPAVQTAEQPTKIKRTYYLPTDVAILLDRIQIEEFQRTGTKPELSAIVADAIRTFGESRQQAS